MGEHHERALGAPVPADGDDVLGLTRRATATGKPQAVADVVGDQRGRERGKRATQSTASAVPGVTHDHAAECARRREQPDDVGIALVEGRLFDMRLTTDPGETLRQPAGGLLLARGARSALEAADRLDDLTQGRLGRSDPGVCVLRDGHLRVMLVPRVAFRRSVVGACRSVRSGPVLRPA